MSTNRPKVLALATTLPASPGDGTPEFVLQLALALSDRFRITIVAPRVDGGSKEEEIEAVRIVRFPYFPKRFEGLAQGAILPNLRSEPWRVLEVPSLLSAFWWATWRECRRNRPALIHAHWIVPSGLVTSLVASPMSIPFVVTAHGADGFALQSVPFRLLKKFVMRRAALTSGTSSQMAEKLGLGQSQVVPMGVDVDSIAQRMGTRSPEPGRFLFVGRLEDKKGVDVLLRALAQVDNTSLVVIGDGRERARLEALAREISVDGRVTFLGRRSHSGVLEEMRRCCALVIPSRVGRGGDSDTTPLVMSEAMAARVPILASDLGGLSERISSRENGLLFRPGSVSDIASALKYVLDNPEDAKRWASKAWDVVRNQLDISVTAERYADFYSSAINRRGDLSQRDLEEYP